MSGKTRFSREEIKKATKIEKLEQEIYQKIISTEKFCSGGDTDEKYFYIWRVFQGVSLSYSSKVCET